MDRSRRTLEDYRELFWEAEKTIEELQAKLDAVEEYYRILEAKLDAVKEVESYSIELQDFGEPATVMLTKDVLKAIGEQNETK